MLSYFLRILLALCDWRAWSRRLTGRAMVDVVFITNLRDDQERRRYFGSWMPAVGHANGPRLYMNGVAGRMRCIHTTSEEMAADHGARKARMQTIAACEWAVSQGAKVVLLGEATARLFGRDAAVLKERFPSLLFTTGINGTAHLLWADVHRALKEAQLASHMARVLVVGPYGVIGAYITRQLLRARYLVSGCGANEEALAEVGEAFGIHTSSRLSDLGEVDAVVACMPSATASLSLSYISQLRRIGRKLLLLDLAQPANLDAQTYQHCRDDVVRQNASHASAQHLQYVLGSLCRKQLGLPAGVLFSCFAEAMALYYAIHMLDRQELASMDWLKLDDSTVAQIAAAYRVAGISLPAANCFGVPIGRFDLTLSAELPTVVEFTAAEALALQGS